MSNDYGQTSVRHPDGGDTHAHINRDGSGSATVTDRFPGGIAIHHEIGSDGSYRGYDWSKDK